MKEKKIETSEQKLTFNITYYPFFQNIRNILQELFLLFAPDKGHEDVFCNKPAAGFCIGKSLKDYLARSALLKTNETRRCQPYGKETCLVDNSECFSKL